MPDIADTIPAESSMSAVLKTGLDVIDLSQTVTFTLYTKVVLPIDGFVFWVKTQLLSESAIVNASAINSAAVNQGPTVLSTAQNLVAQGSLHISSTNTQGEDESFTVNRCVFTSKVKVNDLNEIAAGTMYLAKYGEFRFAFSQRSSFYRQADLYHYSGDAMYPIMEAQVIDTPEQLSTLQVVSNSLPIFLALNAFVPMYPSVLIADNLPSPYCAVAIDGTRSLQGAPLVDRTSGLHLLCTERVRLITYGLRNDRMMDFLQYLITASRAGKFGFMSSPAIVDHKRTQVELDVIAQKKSLEFQVSYYQSVAHDIARQLILTAIPSFIVAN